MIPKVELEHGAYYHDARNSFVRTARWNGATQRFHYRRRTSSGIWASGTIPYPSDFASTVCAHWKPVERVTWGTDEILFDEGAADV